MSIFSSLLMRSYAFPAGREAFPFFRYSENLFLFSSELCVRLFPLPRFEACFRFLFPLLVLQFVCRDFF